MEKESKDKMKGNVIIEDQLIGTIGLSDKIREESYDAIRHLHEAGIKT